MSKSLQLPLHLPHFSTAQQHRCTHFYQQHPNWASQVTVPALAAIAPSQTGAPVPSIKLQAPALAVATPPSDLDTPSDTPSDTDTPTLTPPSDLDTQSQLPFISAAPGHEHIKLQLPQCQQHLPLAPTPGHSCLHS
jgi:hypothetical protein